MGRKKLSTNTVLIDPPPSSFRQKAWIAALLAVLCLSVFAQVVTFDFINWDDNLYIFENPHIQDGVTWKATRWAFQADLFFDSPNADYWQPITFLSRLLDVEFWGMNPAGHHFTNLLLHIANVILVFFLFSSVTNRIWTSAWLAAAFAIHPLQVDSVAWVTERKDVLSIFWALIAFWNYAKYVEKKSWLRYGLALFLFMLSLLSKPALLSFPILLVLLDYWPFNRIRSFSELREKGMVLLLEKIPFALLSLSSVYINLFTFSKTVKKSVQLLADFHIPVSYVEYLGDFFYPVRLLVAYPWNPYPFFNSTVAIYCFVLVVISIFIILVARRQPHLLTGWFWFIFALIPAVGLERGSRFMYAPILGLLIMTAWSADYFLQTRKFLKKKFAYIAVILILIWAGLSFPQVSCWKDTLTLFNSILTKYKNHAPAENGIGGALLKKNDFQRAEIHLRRATVLDPGYAYAHNNLGWALFKQGKYQEAEKSYRQAIAVSPDFVAAYNNLGLLLVVQGELDEATQLFKTAFQIMPESQSANALLGKALAQKGEVDQAIVHLNKALQLNPRDTASLNELAVLLAKKGQYEEAILLFQGVLQLNPHDVQAVENLKRVQLQNRSAHR